MSLLSVNGLAIDFDTPRGLVHAVHDVGLDVAAGEIVGVVGESGSGKSVTAHSLLGLLPREGRVVSGSVLYLGQNLLDLSRDGLKAIRGSSISMIFQSPQTALNPIRPVGLQIADVLTAHGKVDRAQARDRAVEALQAVGIEQPVRRFHAYPFELSGGMCQRVMIAMAIACEPRLLIADEPTTGLDVTTQKRIMDLIVEIVRQRGMSIILITHDLGLAAQYCDRIVVMQQGAVVEEGPSAQLFANPGHPYTRRLLAATPHLNHRLIDLLPDADRGRFQGTAVVRPKPVLTAPVVPVLKTRQLSKNYRLARSPMSLLERIELRRRAEASAGSMLAAVDSVDLEIGAGECVGLVGESGSGKTTTSRLIARLVDANSGSIELLGQEIASLSPRAFARAPARKLVQMVFQDPSGSLDPRRTAFDAIAEPLRRLTTLRKPSELRSRVEETCRLVGLSESLLVRYPHQLSGGQKARVGIARAVIVQPALVVLDEPTSALDVSIQAVILNELDKLKRELSLSYLFVTHDLNIVRLLCDRVLVMRSGKIVETGPVAEVFARPQHPYTRELLSAIPALHRPADAVSQEQRRDLHRPRDAFDSWPVSG